ncbi:GGDEF domain-containing protein [Marinobacter zhanjiangensis]|uniref:GGDEF domain-containing protein n=1 Tax=Marinobacter zhanjiangensis TaxID=578215 RepID=A0ABQ3B2M6_9GAMM|nr:GGDEF domain-containing protein [Marinobacter zhanjiangensis]
MLDKKTQGFQFAFADALFVAGHDGTLLYSSEGSEGETIPAWPFLSDALAGQDGDNLVTPVYIEPGTGRSWIFSMRTLHSDDNAVTGMLVIRQPPAVLAESLASLSLADGQSIAIVDETMALVARLPAGAGTQSVTLGPPRISEPRTQAFIESGQQKAQATVRSPIDGAERFYGFRRVDDAPYIVVVGEKTSVALESWWQSLWVGSTGILLVAIIGLFLLKQFYRRQRAEQGLIHENQERKRLHQVAQSNEARLEALVRSIPDLVLVIDEQGRFVFVHAAEKQQLLMTPDQLIGRHYREVLSPELADRFSEAKSEVLESRETLNFDYHLKVGNELRAFEARVNVLRDEERSYNGFLALVRDVTEQKVREAELRIASAAFETHLGIMITDKQGLILRANHAFTAITGYAEHEVVGKTPAILRSGLQGRAFYNNLWARVLEKGAWEGEIWNRRKNGEVYAEWLTISVVRNSSGAIQNFVGTFHDITRRKEAEREAHRLAFYDTLTGLANKALLEEKIAEVGKANTRQHTNAALLYLDIEQFRAINDSKGYGIGDLTLKALAERLSSIMRETDTLARVGSDEFAVLLPGLHETEKQAARSAERVADKILAMFVRPIEVAGQSVQVEVSIGITLIDDRQSGFEGQLQRAEQATQQAKDQALHRGRKRIAFFDPEIQKQVVQHVLLEEELRAALAQDQLRAYYQPQVQHPDQLMGYEVLLRWQHPERGMVSPAVFIPIAEQSRLILPIGEWVLEKACRQLAAWKDDPATAQLVLAVNVSIVQFQSSEFIEELAQILRQTGAPPAMLKLEVTESLLMDDPDRITRTMKRLRALGVRFSLDDFGTGYSSLSYLRRLPLDQVKIDQSFIREVTTSTASAAIVESMIGLARGLTLDIIAEGVETPEQRDWLVAHGCTYFQGYLFGRPEAEPRPLTD